MASLLNMLPRLKSDLLEETYRYIMDFSRGLYNDEIYACILSSQIAGKGILPVNFGLNKDCYKQLLLTHFPDMDPVPFTIAVQNRNEQSDNRDDEREEVYQLLLSHRIHLSKLVSKKIEPETWLANIISIACQGQDHLWKDLGLWSRDQLSKLMMDNFPLLASKNNKNMKWKKFIYKQLCITEGIYTCRAPSCNVCVDYKKCFSMDD